MEFSSDPRSWFGMNYQKKGLEALINLILEKGMFRLVLTHKDRLLRFGAELILPFQQDCMEVAVGRIKNL